MTTHGIPRANSPRGPPDAAEHHLGDGNAYWECDLSLSHLTERGLQVRRAPAKRVEARLRQDRMSGPPEKTTLASSGDAVPEVRTQGSRGESVITQFCHGTPLDTSRCRGSHCAGLMSCLRRSLSALGVDTSTTSEWPDATHPPSPIPVPPPPSKSPP